MKVAKAKGRLRGKQPKLNRGQEAHLVSLVHSGEYSTLEVAELFGVGRSTVYRAIERQRGRSPSQPDRGDIKALTHQATAPAVPLPTPQRDAGATDSHTRVSTPREVGPPDERFDPRGQPMCVYGTGGPLPVRVLSEECDSDRGFTSRASSR